MRYGDILVFTPMTEIKRNLISSYFSLDEILANNDTSELIDLIQDPAKVATMPSLLFILDNLSEDFGKPIFINSFYRMGQYMTARQ